MQNMFCEMVADALRGRRCELSDKRQYTIEELREENARLRSALNPVLDVNREDCSCLSEFAIRCMNAVKEAQRICKGDRECEVK